MFLGWKPDADAGAVHAFRKEHFRVVARWDDSRVNLVWTMLKELPNGDVLDLGQVMRNRPKDGASADADFYRVLATAQARIPKVPAKPR